MAMAYILFRRAYEEDDFEYGSFEPIFVTLDKKRLDTVFGNIITSVINSNIQEYNVTETTFEYTNKKWCYEYKTKEYLLDTLCPHFRKDKE